MKKYFDFLEELRHSGRVNMYGATPYLQKHFPELTKDSQRAREILRAWMDRYQNGGGEQ